MFETTRSLFRTIVSFMIVLFAIYLWKPEIFHEIMKPFLENIEVFYFIIGLWILLSILKKVE